MTDTAAQGPEWGFYVVDEDRSWDWSNHVYTLGWVANGFGVEPEDAWLDAIQAGRVPEQFDIESPPTVAIRVDHERTASLSTNRVYPNR